MSHEDLVLRPCGERTNCARAAVCPRLEDLLDDNKTILNDNTCVQMEVEHFGNTATATQVSQLAVHALAPAISHHFDHSHEFAHV